jgi:hypothetical protein
MTHPYRVNDAPMSATEKVARDAEREMLETFARILSTTDPRELDPLVARLDRLAHERCLAIRLEVRRREIDFRPRSFVVTAEGLIEEVEDPRTTSAKDPT